MPTAPIPPSSSPLALVRHPSGEGWYVFSGAREILRATRADEVDGVLRRSEEATEEGHWAVGALAYEAAPAFDPALVTHADTSLPLAWFAICDPPTTLSTRDLPPGGSFAIGEPSPALSDVEHAEGVGRVRSWIARGETYQVNYTYQLRAPFAGDPWGLFLELWRNQRSSYAAWLDLGDHAVCSVSPELFFELGDGRARCRPMKGTAARGRFPAEDRRRAEKLRRSRKNRAENVMIVDMIRNDLGRIARAGSVATESLFDVERYPTVFQMTSSVACRTPAGARETLRALFPCASITGAPKVRTMELVRELEREPRGLYTGAIGWLAPRRRARFSVAIRTALVDRAAARVSYGTGGGIVWDSEPASEYAESVDKARVLTSPAPAFELLETILWEPGGYRLLDEHLDRLLDSAAYFAIPLDRSEVARRLAAEAPAAGARRRVRLLVGRDGGIRISAESIGAWPSPLRLRPAAEPVDSSDVFLFHKTTHREVYERACGGRPVPGVLLWNERGEITESPLANVVLELRGRRFTPALDCGLLPGTLRRSLLDRGEIEERVIRLPDLASCTAAWLLNSVRGRVPVGLPPTGEVEATLAARDETAERELPY